MLVAQTNAWVYIGRINPGVGYWWYQTNGQWWLYVPPAGSVHANVFWPTLCLCGLCGIGLFELWLSRRRKEQ